MVTLWRLTPLSSSKVLTEGLGSRRRLAGLSQGEGRPRGLNKREAPWEGESAYKILDFWANVPISRQTKGRSELGSRC